MKKSILIALCATSISFTAFVSAAGSGAILDEAEGSVMVNQGEKFVAATEGQTLNPGDRLMVGKTGNAKLVFGKDCETEVKANTMVTIPDVSICEGGQLVTQSMEPGAGNAPGTGGGTGAAGTNNTGIYVLAGIALAIDAYEINKSP